MIATQDITFGITSQSLVLDCEDGPITSVTSVAVYEATSDDTATAIVATTGSAAVDSVTTTTSAAAGASQTDTTAIALTSAASVAVGRVYRLAKIGKYEDVEIIAISGTTVYTRNPMINDYASGATFIACRATIGVDSTFVAGAQYLSANYSPNPRYRVRWLVVVAGSTRVYDRYFDLVRYESRHGVIPADIENRHPGWLDTLPIDSRADQGRALIARAFQQVKMDLYQDGKADTSIRDAMAMAELVIARAMLLRLEDDAMRGALADVRALDVAAAVYRQRYDGMVRAPFLAVDLAGGGGAATVNIPMPIWRR